MKKGQLTIRPEQLEAFAQAGLAEFEDRIVAHIESLWPSESACRGDDGTRAIVRSGIHRAGVHGLRTEYDVCRFVDLMFVLGDDFDTAAETLWASEILGQRERRPRDRMNELWRRAKAELAKVEPKG